MSKTYRDIRRAKYRQFVDRWFDDEFVAFPNSQEPRDFLVDQGDLQHVCSPYCLFHWAKRVDKRKARLAGKRWLREERGRAAAGRGRGVTHAVDWQHTLSALPIGASIMAHGAAVGRLSNNRFVVLKDGALYDLGGDRSRVGYVIAEVSTLLGQPIPAPCADCGAPRQTRSYCNPCASRRVQRSKRAS